MSALPDAQAQLEVDIESFRADPLGFVMYAFPWGEAGTPLADEKGPRDWQREELETIGRRVRELGTDGTWMAIQEAVASGHGIGKSTLVSWLVLWAMSTCVDTRGVVTANTDTQLRTKTWPEVAKWFGMMINRHWFHLTATAIYSADKLHERNWRIDIIPWSETNTEAFAGLHNKGKRIIVIFDEGSGVADLIWEVTEGALTDEETEIIWCVFGNPTRNTGRFRECFGRLAHRWGHRNIDSRTVPGTNKAQAQAWVDDYGEDSDFVRVRVRGMFPRASEFQLIDHETVTLAMKREESSSLMDPLIMGIDIARGGGDNNVIQYRRGMDARSIPRIVIPGSETRDTTRFVSKVVELAMTKDPLRRPDAIFVDATGVGGPIADRLRQLGAPVFDVQFSWSANDKHYANFVTEIWVKMRDWLKLGGAIPNDADLERELTTREYTHDKRDRLIVVSKEVMKRDGLSSPDGGDALALTFAFPVEKKVPFGGTTGEVQHKADYNPYA